LPSLEELEEESAAEVPHEAELKVAEPFQEQRYSLAKGHPQGKVDPSVARHEVAPAAVGVVHKGIRQEDSRRQLN